MARRYSTRSRRADGSATAEPAVGGRITAGLRPPEQGGLFERVDLQARLDELREASRVVGAVIVLTGPLGSGKSALCEALLWDIDPDRCAASVTASEFAMPYVGILSAVLKAYGFAVEASTAERVMAELIAHHAGDPSMPGRQCVVIVDDAEHLSPRELQALLSLVGSTALTLVLAVPLSFVAAVHRSAEQAGVEVREVSLDSPDPSKDASDAVTVETREPVRSGRARGRRSRSSFSDLVDQWLARLRAAAAAQKASSMQFGFPRRHLAILAGLVVLLGAVWLLGLLAEEVTTSATTTQRVETLEMPPLPAQTDDPNADEAAAARASPGTVREASPAPDAVPESSERPAARPIIARPNQEARPNQGVRSGQDPAQAVEPSADARSSQARSPSQPAAPIAAPPVAPVAAAPPTGAAEAIRQPADRAVPPPPATARPAPAGAARDANWILTQPAGAYTLQLVSLSSLDRARAYIGQQPDPGAFATYQFRRNGQIFHVVIYGSFASKAQADQALRSLPRSVGNVQPWVRQFGQVQESIRSTPQQ